MNISRSTLLAVTAAALVATGAGTLVMTTTAHDETGPLVPAAWATPDPSRTFATADTGAPTHTDRQYWQAHRAENQAAAQAAWQAEQDRLAAEAAAAAQAQAQAQAAQAAAASPAQPGGSARTGGGSSGAPAAGTGGGQPAAPTLPPSGTQANISGMSCTLHDGHFDLTFTVSFDNGYRQGPITMHNSETYLGELSTGGNWYPAYTQFDCPNP